MKISIITPSLNSEKYIENNLKSVHLQQNGNFSIEQIIVDGNSTDRTIEIIESFKRKYNANIKIIQGKDKNMYDAINKGLRMIGGDIWACLNTDDYYYPGVFDLVVKEFNLNLELDVVYSDIDIIDENNNFLRTLYMPTFDLNYLILKGHCLTISQPASFLRRQVLDKVGYFDETYNYAADYDYFIRIGATCEIKHMKKSFTSFRIHTSSISYNDKTKILQEKESKEISKRYINKYYIKEEYILLKNLKFHSIQIKMKNIKYFVKRVFELLSYKLRMEISTLNK